MSQELYYTPPEQEMFDEMKKLAIDIRNTYDNTYWYASDKIDRIKDLENIRDNFMYIFAMFDIHNQKKLVSNASWDLLARLFERLWPKYSFIFLK